MKRFLLFLCAMLGVTTMSAQEAKDFTLTFDPELGVIESISTLTIGCEGGMQKIGGGTEFDYTLYDENNNIAAQCYWNAKFTEYTYVQDSEDNYTSITAKLKDYNEWTDKTITEAGTYTLTIKAGGITFADGSTNEEIVLVYTIKDTTEGSDEQEDEQGDEPEETVTGSNVYSVDSFDGGPFIGIYRVSNNGQYAVTSEGVLSDDYVTLAGLLWDRSTGEYTVVNPDYDGTAENGVLLHDVADDGMMVGAFPNLITPEDGSDAYYQWQPGWRYLDDEWHALPIPDNADLSRPLDLTYCSFAKRVSSDGRIILGECYLYKDDGKRAFQPVQWFLDEDKNLVEMRTFPDLYYPSLDGFNSFDMNDDGVIVGRMCTERGSEYYPAMIMDGELIAIATPKLILQEGYDDWYLESEEGYDEEPFAYWDGCINSMDSKGNIYYYYYDGVEQLHSGVKNIYTGKVTEYDGVVSCGIEGFVVGFDVLEGQEGVSIEPLYSALNMSEDGTVVAGGCAGYTSWGEIYEYPALIVYSESPAIEHDPDPDKEPDPDSSDGIANVPSPSATSDGAIYNLAGQRVNDSAKGIVIIDGKKVIK